MDRDNVVVYAAWPVSWSGIWVGTLAALAVGLIIGLIGTAVGAHEASRYVDWKKVRLIGLVFSVAGAFFAFVVGGWVAARIAGITRAETAILHGAIVWLWRCPCCSSSPHSAWPDNSAAGTGGFPACRLGPRRYPPPIPRSQG